VKLKKILSKKSNIQVSYVAI